MGREAPSRKYTPLPHTNSRKREESQRPPPLGLPPEIFSRQHFYEALAWVKLLSRLEAMSITLLWSGTCPLGVSLSTIPGSSWAIAELALSGEIPAPAASSFTFSQPNAWSTWSLEIGGFGPVLTHEDIKPPSPLS